MKIYAYNLHFQELSSELASSEGSSDTPEQPVYKGIVIKTRSVKSVISFVRNSLVLEDEKRSCKAFCT